MNNIIMYGNFIVNQCLYDYVSKFWKRVLEMQDITSSAAFEHIKRERDAAKLRGFDTKHVHLAIDAIAKCRKYPIRFE